ncbi:MAG: GTP-binding protein, partial [Victivallales bacterium]|nr:GTP-binding protein [Victivallales bacterium]
MMDRKDDIRNLGIIAHIDAGKTTLTERILHKTGQLRYCGAVDDGTTVSDYMQQERERGISIVSAAVTCFWRETEIDIVDTPGHIDFTAEVERSLRVMDAVVAVFCGVHGVQAQSEMVWRRAMRYGLPSMAFVNKLDRDGSSFSTVLGQLQELLDGANAAVITFPHQAPDGSFSLIHVPSGKVIEGREAPEEEFREELLKRQDALAECAAEWDPEVMERYLEDGVLPAAETRAALRKGVLEGRIVPVFCGSAAKGTGVDALLDGIVDYLPSPAERLETPAGRRFFNVPRARLKNGAEGEFAAMSVVKPFRCEWPCDYIVVRLYSGTVAKGMKLVNNSRGGEMEIGRIWRLQAADLTELDEAVAGEIIGISPPDGQKLPNCCTGDTLVQEGGPDIRLARMKFPEPVVSINLSALDEAGRAKLPTALRELAEADPTLRVR